MALRCGHNEEVVHGWGQDDVHRIMGRAVELSVRDEEIVSGHLVMAEQQRLQQEVQGSDINAQHAHNMHITCTQHAHDRHMGMLRDKCLLKNQNNHKNCERSLSLILHTQLCTIATICISYCIHFTITMNAYGKKQVHSRLHKHVGLLSCNFIGSEHE